MNTPLIDPDTPTRAQFLAAHPNRFEDNATYNDGTFCNASTEHAYRVWREDQSTSGAASTPSETPVHPSLPDHRQLILAALRSDKPAHSPSLTPLENERVAMIYRRAVLAVCRAIEDSANANNSELSSAGVPVEDLTPAHSIGEHLSATRRHFGLIP